MTDDRRYLEEEIAEIFDKAAREDTPARRAITPSAGLTLPELQEIGREVGLPPERIAEAASQLDRREPPHARRTYLGAPISVGRSVDLPRPPTDREWELLVAELRETFRAQGTVRSHGDSRTWSNGNLHASIEPTETGYRLRMGSVKGDAVPTARMGVFGLVMAVVMFAMLTAGGELANSFAIPTMFGAMGAGALGFNVVRLKQWVLERADQMEYIAGRARMLMGFDAIESTDRILPGVEDDRG